MKDKQGEVTIVNELYKVLPVWMDRGAPITDTANVKVQFHVMQENNSNDTMGSSSYPQTGVTFIRLGDT